MIFPDGSESGVGTEEIALVSSSRCETLVPRDPHVIDSPEEWGKALALMDCFRGRSATLRKLYDRFGRSIRALYRALTGCLDSGADSVVGELSIDGWIPRRPNELARTLLTYDATRAVSWLSEASGRVTVVGQEGFPWPGDALPEGPPFLVMAGQAWPPDVPTVAIVGTRRATGTGIEVAERMAFGLASHGVRVISGLARGIDTAAHEGSLAATRVRRTLYGNPAVAGAVLGCGLSYVYPPENAAVYRRLLTEGVLISQYGLFNPPRKWAFPERNRTMAALADVVVVVESYARGGSLSTAHAALELGKEVAAVPGSALSPASEGTFNLLRDGAVPVRTAEDVLEILAALPKFASWHERLTKAGGASAAPEELLKTLDPDAQKVAQLLLDGRPRSIVEIGSACGLRIGDVIRALEKIEESGMLRPEGSEKFCVAI
jgi:DNA processing protein